MSSTVLYDLLIIGGGPAGVAAGVYASRKRLKTAFVAETFGGQSIVSDGIENWIGTIKISGPDLAKSLENHLKAYAGEYVELFDGYKVTSVKKLDESELESTFVASDHQTKKSSNASQTLFEATIIHGATEKKIKSKSILIATGSKRRKLEVKGADIFEHKGVTYCATCDGPLFADTDVAVIGGGNAAFESAAQLAQYCKTVTIFNRGTSYRADAVTIDKVLAKPNVSSVQNAELLEVQGTVFVEKLLYKTKDGDKVYEKPLSAIFVEIGQLPNTEYFKDIVDLDSYGKIIVNPKTQQTNTPGIWAAGDCTDGLYHQNNIAAGDSVKALEDVFVHVSRW